MMDVLDFYSRNSFESYIYFLYLLTRIFMAIDCLSIKSAMYCNLYLSDAKNIFCTKSNPALLAITNSWCWS